MIIDVVREYKKSKKKRQRISNTIISEFERWKREDGELNPTVGQVDELAKCLYYKFMQYEDEGSGADLTDADIIKALECHTSEERNCDECPLIPQAECDRLNEYALNLIKRQQYRLNCLEIEPHKGDKRK